MTQVQDLTYDQACWTHAEYQGLDVAMDALDDHGVEWSLLQSGGFRMLIEVDVKNTNERIIGSYGLTFDDGEWLLVWYPGGLNADQDDDDNTRIYTTKDVLAVIKVLMGEDTVDHVELEQINDDIQREVAKQLGAACARENHIAHYGFCYLEAEAEAEYAEQLRGPAPLVVGHVYGEPEYQSHGFAMGVAW